MTKDELKEASWGKIRPFISDVDGWYDDKSLFAHDHGFDAGYDAAARWTPINGPEDMPPNGKYWFTWSNGDVEDNEVDRRHLTEVGFLQVWFGKVYPVAWMPYTVPPPYKEAI